MATFMDMLQAKWDEGKSVCVGLDSDYFKLPESIRTGVVSGGITAFNTAIVDATKDLVCAYKPNIAFYAKHKIPGLQALELTIRHIRRVAPDVPIILDSKRGDIGNTNDGYVAEAFDWFGADAVTVHGYLGVEAMKPFLDNADKGIIVLCRTSNPGAGEFQDLEVMVPDEDREKHELSDGYSEPLYEHVAYHVAESWNYNNNCGIVMGATNPRQLKEARGIVGDDVPILIPGIGAQKGDLAATVKAGANSRGQGMIINNSRAILFASSGPDFAEAARTATLKMHDDINAVLATV